MSYMLRIIYNVDKIYIYINRKNMITIFMCCILSVAHLVRYHHPAALWALGVRGSRAKAIKKALRGALPPTLAW